MCVWPCCMPCPAMCPAMCRFCFLIRRDIVVDVACSCGIWRRCLSDPAASAWIANLHLLWEASSSAWTASNPWRLTRLSRLQTSVRRASNLQKTVGMWEWALRRRRDPQPACPAARRRPSARSAQRVSMCGDIVGRGVLTMTGWLCTTRRQNSMVDDVGHTLIKRPARR